MAIEKTFQTPGGAALVLAIPSGTVAVDTVDGDNTRVIVEADDEKTLEDVRVELHEAGGRRKITVETERKAGLLGLLDFGGRSGLRVRIETPHSAALSAKTASANVRARGRYASADVRTASGDIELDRIEGNTEVKTASGEVSITEVGGDLLLATVSGDANVRSVAGVLKGQTVSGDLHVQDARGYAATKTVSGDQHLTVEQGQVRSTSVSGDIEIAVRPGSRLDVDASSVSGEMRSELALGDLPVEGEGPVVVLRGKTVSGDFRVVRAAPRESNRSA